MIIFFDIEIVSIYEQIERDLKKNLMLKENYFSWFNLLKEKYGDKLSFMPEFNKIITITVWTCDSFWKVVKIKNLEWDEEEQIIAFFKAIEKNKIYWFNIKNFDLPFIIKRALFHKIEIPDCIRFFWKKPRELENILDLMEVYKNWVFWSYWNLDLICNFLWITSPKDWWIDWSEVQKFYDEWKIEEIKEYCKRDVEATINLYEYFLKYKLIY